MHQLIPLANLREPKASHHRQAPAVSARQIHLICASPLTRTSGTLRVQIGGSVRVLPDLLVTESGEVGRASQLYTEAACPGRRCRI